MGRNAVIQMKLYVKRVSEGIPWFMSRMILVLLESENKTGDYFDDLIVY